MSKGTYLRITRIIRFDNVLSRRQNKNANKDKLAPIRDLWNIWSSSLADCYNPHECVTIDEQLLGFHGRCPFRQYMPKKPEKYGIKFWVSSCACCSYVWKIQPYLGKTLGGPAEKNQGERVVLDLIDGLKGHNITSHHLSQKLLSKDITMVGTMRKNKRSIPPKLLQCKKVPLYSSTFAFTEDTTLVSYVSRKNKCTLLQSTMHNTPDIGTDTKKLPAIVAYYNRTKGGVDTIDKMLGTYSCKRKSNRWPMAVFSNIIDISALNAFVVYNEINPNFQSKQVKTRRRNFLEQLGHELATPHMMKRTGKPHPSRFF